MDREINQIFLEAGSRRRTKRFSSINNEKEKDVFDKARPSTAKNARGFTCSTVDKWKSCDWTAYDAKSWLICKMYLWPDKCLEKQKHLFAAWQTYNIIELCVLR